MTSQELIPTRIINNYGLCITHSLTSIEKDSVLVFVCGAQPDGANPTARDRFMEYAGRHLPNFQFFVAERFFEAFQNTDDINLLSIENKLAEFSDCVMIFLESVGTFTELGAFSNRKDIARILLAINDIEFKDKEPKSFVTAGPIAKLDKTSRFKPTIYANFKSILTAMSQIENRLSRIERKNRRKVDFSTFDFFIKQSPSYRMLFLMDLVSIFNPLSHQELVDILTSVYGKGKYNLNLEISMLKALGLLVQIHDCYTSALNKNTLFLIILGLIPPNTVQKLLIITTSTFLKKLWSFKINWG